MENTQKARSMDRQLIAAGESWEMSYIMRKFRVSEQMIRKAINSVGNSRLQVENYIRRQQMKPAASAS
ncbi:MAG: DUF3606 domain-containing protein [Chitinophagaceae bacterium]|nr:MAG: DUF3606 domain-containing protein [Chitinophagaceae bacterium]